MNPFIEKLAAKTRQMKHLCVGIDPVRSSIPNGVGVLEFCKTLIHETIDVAAVYKPNSAFFEALGPSGGGILRSVIQEIHLTDRSMPVILDAKRGDIAATNQAYAQGLFNQLGADAVTLHPYLGWEGSLDVILSNPDWFGFVLCRTTNEGARELQDLKVLVEGRPAAPLYQYIAERAVNKWNGNGNCGLVAGATYPAELAEIRKIAPEMPLLIPGVGKQSGALSESVAAALNPMVPVDFVINVSSAISEAWSKGQTVSKREYGVAAHKAAADYHDQIVTAIHTTLQRR